jgi:hypothetical protein
LVAGFAPAAFVLGVLSFAAVDAAFAAFLTVFFAVLAELELLAIIAS